MSNTLRGQKDIFLYDGSGSTGVFLADPNSTGVFYFTLKVLYGSFVDEVQPADVNATAPSVLPALPPNVPITATLFTEAGAKVATMVMVDKKDIVSGNGYSGAIYTFTTPILSSGDHYVTWETGEIMVSYGSRSALKIKPMSGSSNTFSASNLPSDRICVSGTVDPATIVNVEVFTDVVDMNNFEQACFILLTGNIASEAITFRLVESATSGGVYTAVSGKSKVYSAHASSNDNVQCQINLKASELTSGMKFVKAGIVTDGASGGPMAVIALGLKPVASPASDFDLATNTIV